MGVEVLYANEKYFPSFYEALSCVAQERIYIEMINPPPQEKVYGFQQGLISKNGPVYYAIDDGKVVGWCDVFPEDNPRQNHRGSLGMGLLAQYRGQGLGTRLLSAVLSHAKQFGLEKVELNVYSTNLAAIALYKKMGFTQEGHIPKYRKLDGQYFDCLLMGKFLS